MHTHLLILVISIVSILSIVVKHDKLVNMRKLLSYFRVHVCVKEMRAVRLKSSPLMLQVGFQASAWVSVGRHIGDEIQVLVEEAHARDDILSLKEVIQGN